MSLLMGRLIKTSEKSAQLFFLRKTFFFKKSKNKGTRKNIPLFRKKLFKIIGSLQSNTWVSYFFRLYVEVSNDYVSSGPTYESCFEIRNDDLARDEAVNLVKKYDGEFPERFADEIFAYLSLPPEEFPVASKMFEQPIMDRAYFERLTDPYRSPHIWKREGDTWVLRRTVWEDR